jgi:hypothetical protein
VYGLAKGRVESSSCSPSAFAKLRRTAVALAETGLADPSFQLEGITVQSNLKSTLLITVAVATGLLLSSGRVFAHHGANLYDTTKPVVLKGTITMFVWGNPHNQIMFDVTDEKGGLVHWVASTEPPLVMVERGWTRKSLNAGDQVTVYIFAAKNGAPVGNLQKIVFPDGKELGTGRGAPPPAAPPAAK